MPSSNPLTAPGRSQRKTEPQPFFFPVPISKKCVELTEPTKRKLRYVFECFKKNKNPEDREVYGKFLTLRKKIRAGELITDQKIRNWFQVPEKMEIEGEIPGSSASRPIEIFSDDDILEMECQGVTVENVPCRKMVSLDRDISCESCGVSIHNEEDSDNEDYDSDNSCSLFCGICRRYFCIPCFQAWKVKRKEIEKESEREKKYYTMLDTPITQLDCDERSGEIIGDFSGVFPCKGCQEEYSDDYFEHLICSFCLKKLLSRNKERENPCPRHKKDSQSPPSSEKENNSIQDDKHSLMFNGFRFKSDIRRQICFLEHVGKLLNEYSHHFDVSEEEWKLRAMIELKACANPFCKIFAEYEESDDKEGLSPYEHYPPSPQYSHNEESK